MLVAAAWGSGTLLGGCESSQGDPVQRQASRGLTAAERAVSDTQARSVDRERPVALIDGVPVGFDELRPVLIEAAGATALEERVLDRQLEREGLRLGITLTEADLAAERVRLAEVFATTGVAPEGDSASVERALERVRRERGLGDERFAGLIRRSAMLRRLVRDEVQISPAAVEQAYELRYGERLRTRVIVVPTAGDAARVIERARAGEPFDRLAIELSTDASASAGGLVGPINAADPTWPAAIRSAAAGLGVGELSPPVGVEKGYAVLCLEERLTSPADRPAPAAVADDLSREVRLRQERLLMDRTARRLLEQAEVSVVDPVLRRTWEQRGRRGEPR